MKILETITAHIDIVKFIERGKKMLNAKLERHLTRPHTLPYEVMRSLLLYIYIYILIWFSIINILYQLKLRLSRAAQREWGCRTPYPP